MPSTTSTGVLDDDRVAKSSPPGGLAHAGSVILMTDCHMRYVGDALRTLIQGGHCSLDSTPGPHGRYREAL